MNSKQTISDLAQTEEDELIKDFTSLNQSEEELLLQSDALISAQQEADAKELQPFPHSLQQFITSGAL